MEILEFLRQRERMCDYYGDATCVCDGSRGSCPALGIDCSFTTEKPEQLVAVVEKWAKEHPEGTAAALKDRVAELEVALKAEPVPAPKPKRTNKDVLLAAFPDARMGDKGIPDVCPRALDKNYNNCNDLVSCSVCRCAYWLAEEDE